MAETPSSTTIPSSAPSIDQTAMEKIGAAQKLTRQWKSGANWFYWIAGLSVINTVISFTGGTTSFIAGLGATQLVDAVAGLLMEGSTESTITLLRGLNIFFDLALIGVFVLFGVFANKGHRWAFIVGMILYFLDTLIFLLVQDFLSIGFHLFALFGLFTGFRAMGALKKTLSADAVISPA